MPIRVNPNSKWPIEIRFDDCESSHCLTVEQATRLRDALDVAIASTKVKQAPAGQLTLAGASVAKCRSCGAPIDWHKTEAGKNMPLDAGTTTPHWATCANADQHRKAKT